MKIVDKVERAFMRKSAGMGLALVIVAAVTLELTALVQYIYSGRAIRQEATMRAESQLESTQGKILDVINQAEAAVRNSVWIAQWCLDVPDSLQRVSQRIVEDNPVVLGSTVALVPGYLKSRPLFSPYVYLDGDRLVFRSLATEEYDYPNQEWFTQPIELDEGYWSEPYVDVGGGEVLMTTFSMPIKDKRGVTAAVLTADISLDWLTDLVGNIKVYPSAYSMMFSRTGKIMVCPPAETLVMRHSVAEVAAQMEDTATALTLTRQMFSGKAGSMSMTNNGEKKIVYFSPMNRTGWVMSIVVPESDMFASIKKVGTNVLLLQLLGLLMLILILRSFFKSQLKYKDLYDKKERIEGELHIARGIQMSMVPKIFPPFPERHDLDMAAAIVPAKEVGGDLYDFYIRDEKLFFCIGDVSGKGVPASLVMAVTRTMFRTVSAHTDKPGLIAWAMNDSMADMNESNMFVTFFCGVLDLATGHLRYSNAGHNPPMILTDAIRPLAVEANLPLGIMQGMEFVEQEIDLRYDDAIFLYTDGLNEAENIAHEQFGEARMEEALHGRKAALDLLQHVKDQVGNFVGEAEQSDDLTMLFIHYLGNKEAE